MHQSTDAIETLVDRILAEGPIGVAVAAKLYGTFRDGRPTHPSTPTRHHLRGVTLPDGTVVRLEAVRIAGRLMTSRAAIIRFLAAQQVTTDPTPPTTARSPAACKRAAAVAAAELDSLGIA